MQIDAKKVILVSSVIYESGYDELLESLVKRNIELFCAVGKDCEKWEEALDWLCVGDDGRGTVFINTTSHPKESLEKVIDFANQWKIKGSGKIQIIRI